MFNQIAFCTSILPIALHGVRECTPVVSCKSRSVTTIISSTLAMQRSIHSVIPTMSAKNQFDLASTRTYIRGRGEVGVRVAMGGPCGYTRQTAENCIITAPSDSTVYISRDGTQIGKNSYDSFAKRNREFAVVIDRKMAGVGKSDCRSAYSRNNARTGCFLGE